MKYIALTYLFIRKAYDRVLMHIMISLFKKYGKNVTFFPTWSSFTYRNISLGNDVYIGPGANFSSATVIEIGNKIMFGPGVTIMGGDHNITQMGRFMFDVQEKLPGNDLPVIIDDDVWIGANAIILKGVRIGKGAVIGAGSVVTRDIAPYCIAAGVPARMIKMRFSGEDLDKHISLLK